MPHQLAWWNYNIPSDQQTEECPDSLRDASEKDRGIIGSHDADYVAMKWEQVKHLVGKA
jgi:hypothetical protein